MNIYKSSRLTPMQRKEICSRYYNDRAKVNHLADEYHVTHPTIYKIIKRGREYKGDPRIHSFMLGCQKSCIDKNIPYLKPRALTERRSG